MGSFFVTGNHDEFSDSAKIMNALRNVGVCVLDNEKVTVHGIQIVGVQDGAARDDREFREILVRSRIDRSCASILLNHQPSHLSIPKDAGISLQLSGHTHRGQSFPFTWFTKRIFRQFTYGLHRFGELMVYTSSGIGTWGPPMRVGTYPEIVVITFV